MRVITFSRTFPKKHIREGEPTEFVEKIWQGLHTFPLALDEYANHVPELEGELKNHYTKIYDPKWHTIRSGNRWKVGDWFHPRVWSGKPYASKQVDISLPIEIKKIWSIQIIQYPERWSFYLDGKPVEEGRDDFDIDQFAEELALNDGLSVPDFISWFQLHPKKTAVAGFNGQILCWNEKIEY